MVDAAVQRQLVECLGDLPIAQQRAVLDFARQLQGQNLVGVPGSTLTRFAGTINAADLDAMATAIETGCERIDADEW